MKKSFIFFVYFLASCGSSKRNQKIKPPFVIDDRYQGIVATRNRYFSDVPIVNEIATTVGEYSFDLAPSEQRILNSIFIEYSKIEGQNNYVYPELKSGARIIWSKTDSAHGRLFVAMPSLYYFCIEKQKYITKLWLWYNEVGGHILGSGDDTMISVAPIETITKIVNGKYKK